MILLERLCLKLVSFKIHPQKSFRFLNRILPDGQFVDFQSQLLNNVLG